VIGNALLMVTLIVLLVKMGPAHHVSCEALDNSSDLNWTAHRLAGDGEAVVPHQRHAIVGLPHNEGHHIVQMRQPTL
jgi:hypothetical protein